ncbi:MAG: IS630 family transposase [Firmicutes bacterium]|nr:IS630 family transposase [Bacillota bacterium]
MSHCGGRVSAGDCGPVAEGPECRASLCRESARPGTTSSLAGSAAAGTPRQITPEARAWIVSLACQKPKDLGLAPEFWSESLLAQYVREHAVAAGHPSAQRVRQGTISQWLAAQDLPPPRVTYYLQRRDPEFDAQRVPVLHVYQPVEFTFDEHGQPTVRWSSEEKPGIQALGTTAPDRPPQPAPGQGPGQRDPEDVRHGTVSLLAGIDLATGEILAMVRPRHRSAEFVEFLQALDQKYPPGVKIPLILDNHSAHTSRETRAYLATVPNRFDFVFTPKHASWLNLIAVFFAKLSKQCLKGIRVNSAEELADRILAYIDWLHQDPMPFRWRWAPHTVEDAHVI